MARPARVDYWAPMCLGCVHFREQQPGGTGTCSAYPAGIPAAVWTNEVDHRKPYAGDMGIQYEPKDRDAEDYANWVFGTPSPQ